MSGENTKSYRLVVTVAFQRAWQMDRLKERCSMQPQVLVSFMIRKSYCRTVYDLMFCAERLRSVQDVRGRNGKKYGEENRELHIIKSSSFLMFCKCSFCCSKAFSTVSFAINSLSHIQ